MKHFMVIALLTALALGNCTSTPANGDFEIAAIAGRVPNWTVYGSGLTAAVSSEYHSGARALAITTSGTGSIASDAFAVRPGAGTLAFWARVQGVGVSVQIAYLDANGARAGAETVLLYANNAADWTQRTATLPVPASAVTARVVVQGVMFASSSAQLDDITFTQ